MEFPAVTMCSYNLIPRHLHTEANLQHLNDFVNILDKLPIYNISVPEKLRCMKDPLCRWLRFTDRCRCGRTACDSSTECYPHKNESICACSRAVCLPRDDDPIGCRTIDDEGQNICVCEKDFQYHRFTPKTERVPPNFLAALERIQASKKVKDLMKALKNSSLVGLRDVDGLLKPNITIRDNYGISYDNLILSCTFGSVPCDARQDMSTLYSPTYGKCYTFNYAGVENPAAKVKIVRHAGRTHGLLLYMKSPRDSIFPLFTPNHGARIVVHDPRSLPFASQNGFDIRSGDMTTVVVQYEEVNRLGPPWTKCAWDGDNKTSSYLLKPYSMLGCMRQCMNGHIFKRCKCYFDRFFSGTIIPHRTHVCSLDKVGCVLAVVQDRNQNKITCRCPPPCREKKYDVSISAGKINREFFRVMKKVRTLKMINGRPSVAEPEFNLGLMGLHVYVGSFAAIKTTETSIYSWEFLVSNVGGNLGLFLGLSLITFVEVAEFVVETIARVYCQKKRSFK